MASPPAFRLFGFPVHVRTGFVIFLVLVVAINGGGPLALWLATFMAVFTLLHELGHAVAARATGAKAEISLDFFYGYAAFTPTRPLKRWERAGISFAGPATQIAISTAVLLAMRVNPLDIESVRSASHAAKALWWAGPVIGAFNLAPVLPFDGGNIVQAGLDTVFPGRSRAAMVYVSIAITAGAVLWMLTSPSWRNLAIFAMIPLFAQLQMLGALRAQQARPVAPAGQASIFTAAEAVAWRNGDTTKMPAGQQPSPWLLAHLRASIGDVDGARRILVDSFAQPSPRWVPPDAAPAETLRRLVWLLPDPLPTGQPYVEHVLADVLLRTGDYRRAAHYAADSYGRGHRSLSALAVARAAAALGDRPTALAWLRTSLAGASPESSLRHHVAMAAELDPLREDPEFVAMLQSAA